MNLQQIVQALKRENFENEAGYLSNFKAFHEIEKIAQEQEIPDNVRQTILDMCDDWSQSEYEDDDAGKDRDRANAVLDWFKRRNEGMEENDQTATAP